MRFERLFGERPRATPDRRIAAAGLWVLALAFALRLALLASESLDRPSHGFVTYYTAARMVLGGEPLEGLYDRAWFADRIKEYEPTVYDFFRPNPPPAALIVAPVALFPYRTARAIWLWANVLIYAAAVLYLGQAAGLSRIARPAFACLAFTFQSIASPGAPKNLQRGRSRIVPSAASRPCENQGITCSNARSSFSTWPRTARSSRRRRRHGLKRSRGPRR